jgi:hypothetical protein
MWDSKKEKDKDVMGNPQPRVLETGSRFRD